MSTEQWKNTLRSFGQGTTEIITPEGNPYIVMGYADKVHYPLNDLSKDKLARVLVELIIND